MDNEKNEMSVVTEIGVFGSLNIEDPTVKKIKKKKITDEDLEVMIQESIVHNANI